MFFKKNIALISVAIVLISVFPAESREINKKTQDLELLRSVKNELIDLASYSDDELKKNKEEFQEYYIDEVKNRVDRITDFIKIFIDVDVDWDGIDDLIITSSGLAPSAWGPKEFIAVIKRKRDGSGKIIAYDILDDPEPSVRCEKENSCSWALSKIYKKPNKGKGYNDFVMAVIEYAALGASGSSFFYKIVGYNRYSDKVEIDTISSPVRFSVYTE